MAKAKQITATAVKALKTAATAYVTKVKATADYADAKPELIERLAEKRSTRLNVGDVAYFADLLSRSYSFETDGKPTTAEGLVYLLIVTDEQGVQREGRITPKRLDAVYSDGKRCFTGAPQNPLELIGQAFEVVEENISIDEWGRNHSNPIFGTDNLIPAK